MIEVSKEKLDRILALYTPNYRYLVQASVGHPNAEGQFKLQPTQYTSEPLHHMTSIEAQLCLNQLLYTAFGEWIPEGRFNVRIPFEQYLELMKENMFIIESGIRFRKPIQTNND